MWAKFTSGAGHTPKSTVTATHTAMAATVVGAHRRLARGPAASGASDHERERAPRLAAAVGARAPVAGRRRAGADGRRRGADLAGAGAPEPADGEYMRRMTRR